MPRAMYEGIVALPDVTGLLKALSAIQVSVYERGTANLVTVYQAATGVAQGPTPASGATGGPNPFLTGPGGAVEFWAEGPDEYDIEFLDTVGPPRMATRSRAWNSLPLADGTFPTSKLASDGGLNIAMMGDTVLRQLHQIGEVIDWWRPASTVPVPLGFEICDGHSVAEANHDFPIAGAINVPDLRNAFVLGATTAKSDGTGAVGGDLATDAPGIRGAGGSMKHTLASAESGVAAHGHGHNVATGASGSHDHTGATSPNASLAHNHTFGGYIARATSPFGAATDSYGPGGSSGLIHTLGSVLGGVQSSNDSGGLIHSHPIASDGGHTHGMTGGVTGHAGAAAGSAHNNMPRFVGLLKLVKVRYA